MNWQDIANISLRMNSWGESGSRGDFFPFLFAGAFGRFTLKWFKDLKKEERRFLSFEPNVDLQVLNSAHASPADSSFVTLSSCSWLIRPRIVLTQIQQSKNESSHQWRTGNFQKRKFLHSVLHVHFRIVLIVFWRCLAYFTDYWKSLGELHKLHV